VLALLPGTALAQTPDHANDEAPLELPADAPLDLSTPELEPGKLTPTTPFAEKPPASDWAGKVGIDYSKPAIPAVMFQPEQLLAGAVPDQSSPGPIGLIGFSDLSGDHPSSYPCQSL